MSKIFYENYWRSRGRSNHRPRYDIFEAWIEEGSKVLDIGCGDGYFGEQLLKCKNIEFVGADISETALDIARSRGINAMLINTDDGLDVFDDKSFDYIVMSEFLEHIPNSEKILEEAKRIVRKAVLVSIPNIAYWRYRIQLMMGHFPKQWHKAPYEHLRYWSVSDFTESVRSLGFTVKACKSSNGKKILRDIWPNLFGFQVCFYLEPFK